MSLTAEFAVDRRQYIYHLWLPFLLLTAPAFPLVGFTAQRAHRIQHQSADALLTSEPGVAALCLIVVLSCCLVLLTQRDLLLGLLGTSVRNFQVRYFYSAAYRALLRRLVTSSERSLPLEEFEAAGRKLVRTKLMRQWSRRVRLYLLASFSVALLSFLWTSILGYFSLIDLGDGYLRFALHFALTTLIYCVVALTLFQAYLFIYVRLYLGRRGPDIAVSQIAFAAYDLRRYKNGALASRFFSDQALTACSRLSSLEGAELAATGSVRRRIIERASTYFLKSRAVRLFAASLLLLPPLTFGLIFLVWYRTPDFEQLNRTYRSIRVPIEVREGRVNLLDLESPKLISTASISAETIRILLSREDSRFYAHYGVDPVGVTSSVLRYLTGQTARLGGGSTITQQLAKNLLLNKERTVLRKLRETLLALKLETYFSKQEILERYLNTTYFGSGAFGLDRAAHKYFGKGPQQLNPLEAASLAVSIPSPSARNPQVDAESVLRLAREHLLKLGYNELELDSYSATLAQDEEPARIRQSGFVRELVRSEMTETAKTLPDGNYTIVTTLQASQQHAAERAARSAMLQAARYQFDQIAVISLDNRGRLLAMIGSADWAASQFNHALTAPGRQVGSLLKPFLYLKAFENGYGPSSLIDSSQRSYDGWSPSNWDNQYRDTRTIREALVFSDNMAAVNLQERLGRTQFIQFLRDFGYRGNLPDVPSLVLGTGEATLLDITSLYATLAAGRVIHPYVIQGIISNEGNSIAWTPTSIDARPVVASGQSLDFIRSLLAEVVERGTGKAAAINGKTVRGKTGTTQSNRDAYFVGFVDVVTTGVWVGNSRGQPMRRMGGGGLPAQAWHEIRRAEGSW
jgi:membrane peptidoglycan carboxypeptidase